MGIASFGTNFIILTIITTVRTILNRQRWNAGFSIITEANTNGGMRVSASASKNVRSIVLSKYNEMSGRDRGKQSVYCLNYGLCIKHNLRWGYPKGSENRKYLISRPFDFNSIIEDFLRTSKRIICVNSECNRNFPFEQLQFLEFTNMKCPDCQSLVKVISNSETIEAELSRVDNARLLPDVELGILYEIHKSEKSLKPKEIAEELDCSHQLVGSRAKKLDESKGLISREDESGQRVYRLTKRAKNDYFPEAD